MADINQEAERQITEIRQICERIKPLVAIQCITYNHEPYIRDALEGFVMQKTDFPFVAIVHDDASTDKTAEIVKEYAEKYPDLILPIYETENQYSKRNGSLGYILRSALKSTGSKYIALCEGDDYWIDSLKLQKQVDFLETHPDYSMCFHSAYLKYEDEIKEDKKLERNYNNLQQREYNIDEIHKDFIVPTCSTIFKTEVWEKYKIDPNYYVGDNVLWTTCASCGRIFCFADKMSVYRINNIGWVSRHYKNRKSRKVSTKKWYLHYKALRNNYPDISTKQIFKNELKYASMMTYAEIPQITKTFNNISNFWKEYRMEYVRSLLYHICLSFGNKIKRILR